MKTNHRNFTHQLYRFITIAMLLLATEFLVAQVTYTYPLQNNLGSMPAGGPDLIVIPNNDGLTGEFTSRAIPVTTCVQGGTAFGYFFEDDAGLQYNNPSGFINQSYSLAMNFQIDEFLTPPSWVRLLSFTHVDDIGVYIKLTNPPTNGTLEFWPYGTVGQWDFFNTVDFYQLILVRNVSGVITIYINGQEFATYDDSGTQKFVPGPPDNFIVFFRDHPSVLANEASPGFVSYIILSNQTWTAEEVQDVWENFCPSLISVNEYTEEEIKIFPNPVTSDCIFISIGKTMGFADYFIYDCRGGFVKQGILTSEVNQVYLNEFVNGIYFLKVQDESGWHSQWIMKQ